MEDERRITDFHAHILPGADHGCESKSMCNKQLQLAAKYGVGTIVATPHFYPHMHVVEEFVALRDCAYSSIADLQEQYGIKIIKAAEVQLCIGLDKMPGLEMLCVGDTNVMLVEIPDMPLTSEMYDTLKRLDKKFEVIVAHTDRYTKGVVDNILEEGYKMQINIESLFDIRKRRWVKDIITSPNVYALGSDIHGPDKIPYSLMKKASSKFEKQFDIIGLKMDKLLGR